jgi:hypothetical protein
MNPQEPHIEFLDPRFEPSQWVPATRKRMALVVYIDWIFFSVFVGLVNYAALTLNPGWTQFSFPVQIMSFLALELVFCRIDLPSPGSHMLSIPLVKLRVHDSRLSRILNNRLPMVDRRIKTGESWLTMILATLLLNEGAKGLIRWTMWTPPPPLFGMEVSDPVGITALVLMGAAECILGYLVFKLRPSALFLGLGYFILHLASTVLSWELWDPWIREYTLRRRDFQGLPIRDGEIEFLQNITPEFQVAAIIGYLLALLITRKRLKYKASQTRFLQ